MIKSIISKPLRQIYKKETGPSALPESAGLILALLDVAVRPEDLGCPKGGLKKLSGNEQDFWSVTIDDSYHIIFRFEDGDAIDVDMVSSGQNENQVSMDNILVKGPMKSPPHPGLILKLLYLDTRELAMMQAAKRLGILRKTLSQLIKRQHPVTPDLALRIAGAFNTSPQLWLNLQHNYNLRHVEKIEPGFKVKHFHP